MSLSQPLQLPIPLQLNRRHPPRLHQFKTFLLQQLAVMRRSMTLTKRPSFRELFSYPFRKLKLPAKQRQQPPLSEALERSRPRKRRRTTPQTT